jgi:iron(II)-dependent oxidoreductase
VDQFPLNVSPFGVADLVGNVWEWTSSDLAMYSGGPWPRTITRRGISDEIVFGKVIRGSWQSDKEDATTTYRRGYPPDDDIDYDNTGFRCVKEIRPAP